MKPEYIKPRELKVTVDANLTKDYIIKVDDYKVDIEEDEDGKHNYVDYSNCNLKDAVKNQILSDKIFDGWNINDYEVSIKE